MKRSNVSYENLLDQLSEEKINRVVDREALRAGGLDLLGGGCCASSTGSKHTDTHSSTTSSANCAGNSGLFGTGL